MIIKDLGAVTAYASAVEGGYSGTEEEFAALMASYATVAEEAAESAESASASATSASASAQTATTKASEASESATIASTKASEASESATTATSKASEASASASTAGTKASEASTSAITASSKASEASVSATSAQTAQGLAESARDGAIDAKTDAETARDLAQQYADSIDPDNIFSAYATDTASGSVASFADGADDIPMKSVVVNIEPVQSGSGDPSPTNVRPISGWTGAQVMRAGVNVWDEEWLNGYYSPTTGKYVSDSRYICSKNLIAVKPFATYHIFTSAEEMEICEYNASGTFLRQLRSGAKNEAVTISADTYYINISTHTANAITTYDPSVKPISINYPSTDHDYHPYAGNLYSITFPSEAGTVYGGVLDVTNGVLTVDRAIIASYNGETLPSEWISDRDKYVAGTNPTTGAQVCYKLSQAVVYTLTPTEIKSLLGDNNIWADAGDTEVTYRADTAKYIDKKIAEVINALS